MLFELISDNLFQIARMQALWNTCWIGVSEFLKWLVIPKYHVLSGVEIKNSLL